MKIIVRTPSGSININDLLGMYIDTTSVDLLDGIFDISSVMKSEHLKELVSDGDLIVNDGIEDLSISNTLDHLDLLSEYEIGQIEGATGGIGATGNTGGTGATGSGGDDDLIWKQSLIESSTTATSYQNKISMSFTLGESCYYKIEYSALWSHEDTGVFISHRLLLNDSDVYLEANEELYNFKYEDGAYRSRAGHIMEYLTAGSYNLKLQYKSGDSGKAAYVKNANISVEKVADPIV